jgi:hypothetical protein
MTCRGGAGIARRGSRGGVVPAGCAPAPAALPR